MNLCSLLLLLILSCFVTSCHSVKACDAMRCRRQGGGKFRLGHRPLKFNEMPYIAVFMHDDKPYCLGVFINLLYKLHDDHMTHATYRTAVLTTCTCAFRETIMHIGFGSETYDYQVGRMKKIKVTTMRSAYSTAMGCQITNTYDSKDFAYVFSYQEEFPSHVAYFKSKNMDIYNSYVDALLEKHENECFGFGFGAYDFIGETRGPFEREGTEGSTLHIYDYRLITDDECEKYVPKCCGKWKDIGGKKEGVKRSKLHCAIRGVENSLCYGLLGSPIICDGYLIGFLKGLLKCSPDRKSYAGPGLFVPISDDFFLNERITLSYSWTRPKPECFADSVREFEIEEIYDADGNTNNTAGGGDDKKKTPRKKKNEEDYYYNFAVPNFFRQSLEAIVLTTMSQLILSI